MLAAKITKKNKIIQVRNLRIFNNKKINVKIFGTQKKNEKKKLEFFR